MSGPLLNISEVLKKRISQHIIFWVAVVMYFTFGYGEPGRYVQTLQRVLLFLPGHIFLTYTFFYFLIPRYLNTQRYLMLVSLGILTYFVSLFYAYNVNFHLLSFLNIESIWIGSPLIGQTTMLGAALSIKFLKQWYGEKKRNFELEQQKTKAELQLLKSQIHPHFLFNTLNNLYSHVLEQSPKSPEIILKLSDLLRFMVYESTEAYISLSNEIELIKHYLDLEHLRYGDRLDISFCLKGDVHNKQIIPLLFLPLIENAFKHGVSNQIDQCWIGIDINIMNDWLFFKIINSKDSTEGTTKHPFGGFGIENVKKRLALVYKDQHEIEIINSVDVFVVNLKLRLFCQPEEERQTKPFKKIAYGNY